MTFHEQRSQKHNAEVVQFRFALIAPVIQGLFPDASTTAYCKQLVPYLLHFQMGQFVRWICRK